MIDHTRAFRKLKTLRAPERLTLCERRLLDRMRGLSRERLPAGMSRYLTGAEIDGLLFRRDLIVRFFEDKIAAEGEPKAVFDFPPREALYRA